MRGRLCTLLLLAAMLAISQAVPMAVQAEEQKETGSVPANYVYVADGKDGLYIIDVSDPTAPTIAGVYQTPGFAYDVAVAGDYAYVADRDGLRIIDVSDPAAPTLLGSFEVAGDLTGSITVVGDFTYLSDGKTGLHVIDVSDPEAPVEVGFYETPARPRAVAVGGDSAYVCVGLVGLEILNVSDPAAPVEISLYNATTPKPDGLALVANHVYVGDAANGLRIINISDPSAPTEEGSSSGGMIYASDVAVGGDYAYVLAQDPSLHLIDVSELSTPIEASTYDTPGDAEDLAAAGDYLFIADGKQGVRIINVSDPAAPDEVGFLATPGYALAVVVGTEAAATPDIITKVRPIDDAVMVYVPAGEFLMGSPKGEGIYTEQPQHEVYLDAFWIDRTEVTNRQFETFVQETGYRTDAEKEGAGHVETGDLPETIEGASWRHPHGPDSDIDDRMDHPAVQMTWNDAQAYCQWAGARLPTEAEWEKACSGTDSRRYPWGSEEPNCDYAVMKSIGRGGGCGRGEPWPVGSKPAGASPYGVLDMAGNAWEWTADWYGARYYGESPASNPTGPAEGTERTSRGGCWLAGVWDEFRCAGRGGMAPGLMTDVDGFRCAMTASDVE